MRWKRFTGGVNSIDRIRYDSLVFDGISRRDDYEMREENG